MREILFRGKRLDDGEWIEGAYMMLEVDDGLEEHRIATSCLRGKADEPLMVCAGVVDPETIGQYTGLDDKNGIAIFEGDIVKIKENRITDTAVIAFDHGAFYVNPTDGKIHKAPLWDYWYNDWDIEIIGNIYDNPEIIKQEK